MSPVYLKWSQWRDEVTEVMLECHRGKRGGENDMEKEMATHSSVLAWRIPGTGEPGGLPSMRSHRVGHNWSDLAAAAAENDMAWFLLSGVVSFPGKTVLHPSSLSSYVLGLSPFPSLLNPCWMHSTISGPLQVWVSEQDSRQIHLGPFLLLLNTCKRLSGMSFQSNRPWFSFWFHNLLMWAWISETFAKPQNLHL